MKYKKVETASPEEIAQRYREQILEIAEKQKEIKAKLKGIFL